MKLKNNFLALLICLLFTIVVLVIHTMPYANTMLNRSIEAVCALTEWLSLDYLTLVVEYHDSYGPFAKRPFVTLLIQGFSNLFKVSIPYSFVLVQIILLFLSGFTLFKVARVLGVTIKKAFLSIGFYYTSYSVLFLFYVPVYTYDDVLQYILLFLSLAFLFRKKWLPFMLFFMMSIMVRESSMLLAPGLFFIVNRNSSRLKDFFSAQAIKSILIIALPVLIAMVFIKLYGNFLNVQEVAAESFYGRLESCFHMNFENIKASTETVIAFLTVLTLPTFFFILSKQKKSKFFKAAFFVTLLINTLVVLFFTRAREARLFAMPMLFLWPIIGCVYSEGIHFLKRKMNEVGYRLSLVIIVISFIAPYFFIKRLLSFVELYSKGYLFFVWGIVSVTILLMLLSRKKKTTTGSQSHLL